jgi:excisionase family DNA binding protein
LSTNDDSYRLQDTMGKTKIHVMARDVSSESSVVEEQPSDAEAPKKLASEVGDLVERLVSLMVNPEPTKPAQLLKAKEVAKLLKTNSQVVYRLVRNQELPAINLGPRNLRFTEGSISEFIKRGGVRTAA